MRYTRENILVRARYYAPIALKWDCGKELNARWCNGRKLHDIHNNFTSTHFSCRNIFLALYTRGDIFSRVRKDETLDWKRDCEASPGHFREGRTMHLLRISKNPRLKTRLWHITKRETMQWKKTTWFRKQFRIHALFKYIYFPRVRHQPRHFK